MIIQINSLTALAALILAAISLISTFIVTRNLKNHVRKLKNALWSLNDLF